MKIVKKIRDIHNECIDRYRRLCDDVKDVLKNKAESQGWFFLYRIKAEESFAQKIETGEVPDPEQMEDFFACTIVVPTMAAIGEAEKLVFQLYDRRERRPPEDARTKKESSSFRFDDLRLYVARRPSLSGRNEDIDGIIFEVQIKTILQHAWSFATHDMVYKSDMVSWPLERIAYQVKAMLEHAEVAIAEAGKLAQAREIAKTDQRTEDIVRVMAHVRCLWSDDRLPGDIRRLASNILALLRCCGIDVEKLPDIVRAERIRLRIDPSDLSPYAFTVQALARASAVGFQRKFNAMGEDIRIVIHDDMDLPNWMRSVHARILNLDA